MRYTAYSDQKENIFGITVKSCGHIFAKHGREINRPNGRDDWLLFYIAKESETFYLDREITAPSGSFIIFKPGERQKHICKGSKTAEFYYIHFTAPEDFNLFSLKTSRIYYSEPGMKVIGAFEEIISELQIKLSGYEKICTFKLLNLLSLLERAAMCASAPPKEYIDKISVVLQAMHRDFDRDLSLEDYAAMCALSKFHFLRVFKNITGTSPVEYRNKLRIEHAKELLCDTTLSVNEISEKTGFSSAAYFCDAFKKKTGMSPARYRKIKV